MAIAEAPRPVHKPTSESVSSPEIDRAVKPFMLEAVNGLCYLNFATREEAEDQLEKINGRVFNDGFKTLKYRLAEDGAHTKLPPAPATQPGPFGSRVIMYEENPIEMAKRVPAIAIPLHIKDDRTT
jgi:hypothetical protein